MRNLLIIVMIAISGPVAADPGHIGLLAGHDHWVAGAAIGIAIIAGLAGALSGKSDDADADDTQDEEEATA
jgi:hypothetical protein